MMDLQWQRQVELWLRLMDLTHVRPASQLTLTLGQDTCYLEAYQGRARLAWSRPVPESSRPSVLLQLLSLLQPEAGGGVPLRAWLARGCLWLEAATLQDSSAESWVQIACRLRSLLDCVTEHRHEAR